MSDQNAASEQASRAMRAATLLWMASVLLSRVMGFLREIVIARTVGANAETDVYFTAFTLPDFVNYLLAGGALSITFIPIFSQYMAEGKEEEGWHVFSLITSFLAVVLTVALGGAMIFAPALSPLVASGFSPEQHEKLVHLTRILLPAQLFIFQGFLLSAVQMAKGQHKWAALSPLVYNGGTILGGWLLGSTLGMEAFAWGVLGGAFVGSFVLQVYGARQVGLRWRFTLDLKHPGFRQYFKLSLPIMVGQSLIVWDEWLTRYFGSFLSAATISWLNYGRKLALVPQAVFGQAAGAASYPYLAKKAAEGEVGEVYRALSSAVRSVLVMALASQAVLTVCAADVCFVLFRSERFGEADVSATAATLMIFSLGIAGWSAQGLLARGFYAFQDTLTPTAWGSAMTLLSAPLYWFLAQQLQHRGLALASTVAISLYAAMLYLLFRRKLRLLAPEIHLPGLSGFFVRLVLVCVLTTGLGYGARELLLAFTGPEGALGQWVVLILKEGLTGNWPVWMGHQALALVRIGLVSVLMGLIFVGACLLLGIDEIRELVGKVLRRVPGGKTWAIKLTRR